MRTVSLIYYEWKLSSVNHFRNLLHIRDHTVIGWRRNIYHLCFRMFFQKPVHIFCCYRTIYPHFACRLWINIVDMKTSQKHCMIGRFMAVSCNQNRSACCRTAGDCGKNSAGASVDQIMGFLRTIQLCRPFFRLFQNPFRMM